uniref:Uncharacterized protein n=1 Tax=uncultured marine bacterium 582 TaxID=257402 RepID=Q6SF02_9BACT|nr:hypothetical protein MBMO_EBAC080-L028H02.84 [uncultured marine bacterium 582]
MQTLNDGWVSSYLSSKAQGLLKDRLVVCAFALPRRTTAKLAGGSALLQTETCIAKILT